MDLVLSETVCFILLYTVKESHRSFVSRVFQGGPDAGFSTQKSEEAALQTQNLVQKIKLIHFTLHLKDTKRSDHREPKKHIAGLVLSPAFSGALALCDITRSYPQPKKPL